MTRKGYCSKAVRKKTQPLAHPSLAAQLATDGHCCWQSSPYRPRSDPTVPGGLEAKGRRGDRLPGGGPCARRRCL